MVNVTTADTSPKGVAKAEIKFEKFRAEVEAEKIKLLDKEPREWSMENMMFALKKPCRARARRKARF